MFKFLNMLCWVYQQPGFKLKIEIRCCSNGFGKVAFPHTEGILNADKGLTGCCDSQSGPSESASRDSEEV